MVDLRSISKQGRNFQALNEQIHERVEVQECLCEELELTLRKKKAIRM